MKRIHQIVTNKWMTMAMIVMTFFIMARTISYYNNVEYLKGVNIDGYIIGFILPFAVLTYTLVTDLLFNMLGIGKYANTNEAIQYKAKKVVSYYFLLIIIGMIAFIFTELYFDFNYKTSEFEHYVNEYQQIQKNEDYQVKAYESSHFLNGKKNFLWKEDTFYNEGQFDDSFNAFSKGDIDKSEFAQKVINIDTDNFGKAVIETIYFVIQTVTTLGYGNITPVDTMGMIYASVLVLMGQFITIIGVALIIRDRETTTEET